MVEVSNVRGFTVHWNLSSKTFRSDLRLKFGVLNGEVSSW
jgi:hypothetical protein